MLRFLRAGCLRVSTIAALHASRRANDVVYLESAGLLAGVRERLRSVQRASPPREEPDVFERPSDFNESCGMASG
jgi:hypothetical protein